ncbi:MAG TPA: ankyrin repeat domain-containing protein [Vicinamibacterales bacterium]|nr:ankyrin repeat domain-containing protein [Vicinamibacterales bacterium]
MRAPYARWVWLPLVAAVSVAAAPRGESLIDAVKNDDAAAVRAALRQPGAVNAAEVDGTTALHWAVDRDDLAVVDTLIAAGADVKAANRYGVTPLSQACENGNAAIIERLLKAGASANMALPGGETALMTASRTGDVPSIKVLLAHGADVQARSDEWSQVMAVVPHGLPIYNRAIPHGGETALMFAARVGDLASARLLVAAGANVNDADAWGVSATVLAEHSGYAELAAFLLDHGADPNAAKAGFSALHEAIMRRDEKMVAALLAHGADPNAPLRTWTPTRRDSQDFHFGPELVGASPLWLAARFSEPNVMRLLVAQGADPLFVHHADYYAGARGERRTEVTTVLMAATGMSAGTPWVPLDRGAREALALDAVTLALERGVDLNAANTDGRTALDAARALKDDTVVAFLIAKGARPGVTTKERRAPSEN